jgi:hypothetical protein
MKDQILKIAKVKSEKEFYKKYPTEEAFMKAHGKAFKKAEMGSQMVNDQLHQLTDFGNSSKFQVGGSAPKFGFNNFGASAENPEGGFGAGAAQAGMSALQNLDKIAGGIQAIGAQKKAKKKAEQATQLSGLALEAQNTMEDPVRKYVRPEDNVIQPGQMGNPYGSGTNFLAENGTRIGGNPTEIQNMYNPGDMYNDLGFEPLEETLKQYRRGGNVPKAELGDYFQDSGQAQIGSAIGESIGSAFGPAGAAVGKFIGKVGGNLLGGAKDARELQAEQSKASMNNAQMAFGQNNQLGAYRKNGGWVSNDWQPQTFTKFGEYSAKDLLKPPHDADMLRSGGHFAQVGYTAPSAEAMFTGRPKLQPLTMEQGGKMALGGELQIGEGGYAETLSYNPNLPGGEIGMFRGASHDNGGIQTQYGENGVEVEGGEPFTVLENNSLEDGNNLAENGSNENLVVFGNIKIKKNIADLMGDPKAKDRKFKHYVADIAKDDAKQLKRIDKAVEGINNANDNSAYGKLKLTTNELIKQGAEEYQKINAEKIKQAGIVQNAILDTASQLGVKSDRLAEGKLIKEYDPRMMAKFGAKMETAQDGTSLKTFLKTPLSERKKLAKDLGYTDYTGKDVKQQEKLYDLFKSKKTSVPSRMNAYDSSLPIGENIVANALGPNYNPTANEQFSLINYPTISSQAAPSFSPIGGPSVPNFVDLADDRGPNYNWATTDEDFATESAKATKSTEKKGTRVGNALRFLGKGVEKFGPTVLSNLENILRPSNANEDLSPDQLYPEYFALATNQLEPVQAQTFQPMLDTPMDISLNDQINAIDSQSRAAIRAAGSNPAAQAMIMAQSLEAKNKVLGEQTRINAANKMQTYDKNRAMLNDAQLKNLQILDNQYVRQAQAKSNTKEQTFNALSSIAAKTAQQRAANRQLAVMENMYKFRFTPNGRAINMNDPAQFNTLLTSAIQSMSPDDVSKLKEVFEKQVSKDKVGNVTGSKEKTRVSKQSRNGSIVNALKNL